MSLLCSLWSITDACGRPLSFAGAWKAEPGYEHGDAEAFATLVPEDAGHALELSRGGMLVCSAVELGFMCSPLSALFLHLFTESSVSRISVHTVCFCFFPWPRGLCL